MDTYLTKPFGYNTLHQPRCLPWLLPKASLIGVGDGNYNLTYNAILFYLFVQLSDTRQGRLWNQTTQPELVAKPWQRRELNPRPLVVLGKFRYLHKPRCRDQFKAPIEEAGHSHIPIQHVLRISSWIPELVAKFVAVQRELLPFACWTLIFDDFHDKTNALIALANA
jgi:hypothetical protein